MSKFLSDQEVRKLIGTVLLNADPSLLNPNGITLRLGKCIMFQSTGEEKELGPGMYLKVSPGESIMFTSLETIDFSRAAVQRIMPGCTLLGFITPTTTMMREGILQSSTKVDSGFRGVLNWGLRNSSPKDLILRYAEPIFKLTIVALDDKEEIPENEYGERENDSYQNSAGIMRSTRQLPADIPKAKTVSSSFGLLDPKKQLREAGYPFDHIGRELVDLHGKFEVVSADVRVMKDEIEKRTTELTEKITAESSGLSKKIDETRESVLEKVEMLFERKFLTIGGVIIGALTLLYSGVSYLQGKVSTETIAFIAAVFAVMIVALTYVLAQRKK